MTTFCRDSLLKPESIVKDSSGRLSVGTPASIHAIPGHWLVDEILQILLAGWLDKTHALHDYQNY